MLPTLYSDEQIKDLFYSSLEDVLARVDAADKLVVLGDFNARVGDDSNTWSEVLGKFGNGKENDNGLRLLMKCTEHGLAITNTFFLMPLKWYGSWRHPRSKHVHLLDYILTKRSDIADFLSTRVVRGAECGTDHFMVRSVVAFQIKHPRSYNQRTKKLPKMAVAKLRYERNVEHFKQQCDNKLSNFTIDQFDSVEDAWSATSTVVPRSS